MPRSLLTVVIAFSFLCISTAAAEKFELIETKEGVTVKLDGQLFTRYLKNSGGKPVLWPIIGPTGKEMTRQHPLGPALPTERKDHPHHRSFWFTHGDVNGISFWHEGNKQGRIVHKKFAELAAAPKAQIVTTNDWVSHTGEKQCEDIRRLTFHADGKARVIDFEITIVASEGEVKFGDTKEGCFGIRVPGTMKVSSQPGGKIVNSHGHEDKAAWGKQAPWVDYYGPVEGETLGIAILNHPSSFRYPTYWHVRTYGLFAANPFGLHNFVGKDKDGSHTLNRGESFTLRYRVIFHAGDTDEANIQEAFKKYSAEKLGS